MTQPSSLNLARHPVGASHQTGRLLTPCLVLDTACMDANIARMRERLAGHSVLARPHVKTAKSMPVIRRMTHGSAAARLTVSTLSEAAAVISAGYRDVLYAVGVVPQKMPELARLARLSGARVSVILDSLEMAQAFVAFTATASSSDGLGLLDAFIELDVDDHRAGVRPESDELIAIGTVLAGTDGISQLRGVMTHAGGAYDCLTRVDLEAMATRERVGAVRAAQRLRDAGIACAEVSIGSTPTVSVATSFSGITEVRVGVYVFNDLVMVGLGVCEESQLALSVHTTVIGHQAQRGILLIDAGWMALSSDRSTAIHAQDLGLGRIAHTNLVVRSANQEHGLVQTDDGSPLDLSLYPIGSELRVLPIHACATAAAFSGYQVFGEPQGSAGAQSATYWPRFGGWSTDAL